MKSPENTHQPAPDQQTHINKTQERLQAQTEIFGDKGVTNFSDDQRNILKYSAELSKITDLNNLPSGLPEDLVTLIQRNKDAYVDFLRKEKKMETSFIEENINTYKEKFQSTIADLKAKISQGNIEKIPEYLGSGSNGHAFKINVDGKTYAAKFSRSITQQNFEIKPLIRAKGIPHTSQLVSYSFEDNVVIMELLPGTDVTNFKIENKPNYTDEEIIQLIEIVKDLDSNGLMIDPKPSNFIYDKEQGFSVLDYHLKNSESGFKLPQEIMSLRVALTTVDLDWPDYKEPNYKERIKSQSIERNKIFLPMMFRFVTILKEKYPDILSEWKRADEEDRKDPYVTVGEIVDRKFIPKDAELEPYLEKLKELGF